MGRLYKSTGEHSKAIGYFLNAMKTLSSIQKEFFQGYHIKEEIFKQKVKAVYLDLAGLYLELAKNSIDQQTGKSFILKARDVVEYLKTAEVQSFFQDECIAQTRQMSRLDQSLPGTAVLYPIIFKNELKLIVNFENDIKTFTVNIKENAIHKIATGFYEKLQHPSKNRFRIYGRKLYNWLIKPIIDDLEKHKVNTLVVSPDGILGLLPFGALFDGKNYLIEKYAVAMIPGITLTDHKTNYKRKIQALACGLTNSYHGFPALPHVSNELESVEKIVGGTILKNEFFTSENFISNLSGTPFNVLHIATHGSFGLTPDQTYLLTHNGKFTMHELRQLVLDLKFRKQPVELITLSACQTATGDEQSALGLAGTALNTGVESALATLWTVDDKASFMLVKKFYETLTKTININKNQTKSKALQTAQKQILATPSFRHPFYWAPFILIGNWL